MRWLRASPGKTGHSRARLAARLSGGCAAAFFSFRHTRWQKKRTPAQAYMLTDSALSTSVYVIRVTSWVQWLMRGRRWFPCPQALLSSPSHHSCLTLGRCGPRLQPQSVSVPYHEAALPCTRTHLSGFLCGSRNCPPVAGWQHGCRTHIARAWQAACGRCSPLHVRKAGRARAASSEWPGRRGTGTVAVVPERWRSSVGFEVPLLVSASSSHFHRHSFL